MASFACFSAANFDILSSDFISERASFSCSNSNFLFTTGSASSSLSLITTVSTSPASTSSSSSPSSEANRSSTDASDTMSFFFASFLRRPAFSVTTSAKCSAGISIFTFDASNSTVDRSTPSFAIILLYAITFLPFGSRYSINPTDKRSATIPAFGLPVLELSASFWHVLQYIPSIIFSFGHCVNSPQLYARPLHPISFTSDTMKGIRTPHFTSLDFTVVFFFSVIAFTSFFPELRFFISFTPTRKFSKFKINNASSTLNPYSILQRFTHSRAYSFVAFSNVFSNKDVTDTPIDTLFDISIDILFLTY